MTQQIEQLGRGGINTDVPPMVLPPNTYTDCNNIRFDDEAVQTTTGETTYKVIASAPTYGIHWRTPGDLSEGLEQYEGFNIFARNGTITRVNALGDAFNMLSSSDSKYNNSDWQGTTFNGGFAIVLNNGKSTPLYCLVNGGAAAAAFVELPGWNYSEDIDTISARVIRSFNYTLVAANLTFTADGTTSYAPSTVRVSTQAAPGSIPQVWQPGLTTDTADEFELSSTSPILDMKELRGNLFIYSSDTISMLSIGSTSRVSPYSTSYGILSTDCVVEVDGKHFVVDRNDIYTHSGSGTIESIADFRIKKYFFKNLNKNKLSLVHVVKNPFYKEIWINYPKGTSTVCNEALVFNYKNNTWSKRTLPSVTYTFNGPTNKDNKFQYGEEVLYMTTNTTQTLVTDDNYLMWNGTALAKYISYVEKKRLNTTFLEGSTLVNALYPVFDKVPSDSVVYLTVTSQNNHMKDETFANTSGRDVFTIKANELDHAGYKVDPRTMGRVLNYRIHSNDYWRLATIFLEAKTTDRR